MNHTLRSVVEEELQKAYERGVQDGMNQERALWEMSNIGQEIERVQKTEKNEPEPVAVVQQEMYGRCQVLWVRNVSEFADGTLLYTAPPKKEWVGLTHTELEDCILISKWATWIEIGRAIEAKLKDKNI